jgi:hypothetical protein
LALMALAAAYAVHILGYRERFGGQLLQFRPVKNTASFSGDEYIEFATSRFTIGRLDS